MQRVAQSLQHRGWEANILYVHTKGASYRLVYDHIEDWRHLMTYFLIERYRDCLDSLSTLRYDAVGVNYSPVPTRHFSGNFWWTTGSYTVCPHYRNSNTRKVGNTLSPSSLRLLSVRSSSWKYGSFSSNLKCGCCSIRRVKLK